jgi:hypothetical protein
MKNYSRSLALILAGACSLMFLALVHVDYFPRSDNHAVRSLKVGVGVPSLPVLKRRAVGTRDAKLALLIASVVNKGYSAATLEKREDRIRAAGAEWHLDIFGDGTAAEFFDDTVASRARASGVDPYRAMSASDLEAAGRNYVARHLTKVIVLRPGERLVPEVRSARIEAGVATDGTSAATAVVANRIVFTPEINGIPVVGAGSKVTITFLNDGSVESFRYDWPSYVKTGRMQRLVPARETLRRLQRVVGVRTNYSATDAIRAPSNVALVTQLVGLRGNMQLERFDCGYYDPGFMSRDAKAPVQAGCYYHVIDSEGSGEFVTKAAYSGAVPAAKRPETDARWPEVAVLRRQPVYGLPAAPSAGPKTYVQPVPPRRIRPEKSP